ncbi:hypothetical protein [Cellulomonas timonensis]|uniref:hypothetical protein n=1 Tax=Cellulomonas timonensis TaxID=1689271 RepID=UPI000835A8AA|nr:hypothetical protein [Cellulomonas timonensis]
MGARPDSDSIGTTTLDTRHDWAALLASAGAGAIRSGVFPGAPAALVTGTAGPGWAYNVAPASYATSRGATDGAHVFRGVGGDTVPTIAAPGTAGASRIDIVYVHQPSKTENGDANSYPVFGVANGAPVTTGSPMPPTIPAGAYELMRNTMTSAATSTASSGNTITQTWRYTALAGSPIWVRNEGERNELTSLASASFPITVERLDTGTLERNAGSGWVGVGGQALTVAPTYEPGWGDLSTTGGFGALAATRSADGDVTVQGVASRLGPPLAGQATSGLIAMLPPGMRPKAGPGGGTLFGAALGHFTISGLYRVNFGVDGSITAQLPDGSLTTWATGGYIALLGASFKAA